MNINAINAIFVSMPIMYMDVSSHVNIMMQEAAAEIIVTHFLKLNMNINTEYFLNRYLNIIEKDVPQDIRSERGKYIVLLAADDSIYIDTFRIEETDQVIDFAYSEAQIPTYKDLLKFHLSHHNVDFYSVYLIRRSYPKDKLREILHVYGIEVE